jgi:hypothetical protein
MSEPHQTEDGEEDPPEEIGMVEDPAETLGATRPRLILAIPLALFASIADNQDTSLETALNDRGDETKPTTPT